MHQDFGHNLKKLLDERNLSIRQLAGKLGISARTVGEWVGPNGRMPRDPAHLKLLASYFYVSVHRLLYGAEDERGLLHEILQKQDLFSGTFEVNIKRVQIKKGPGSGGTGDKT